MDVHQRVAKSRNGSVVVIPHTLTNGKDLVVLTREEYERDVRQTQAMVHALQALAEGERAYRAGKTVKATSLEEALKLYARRSH